MARFFNLEVKHQNPFSNNTFTTQPARPDKPPASLIPEPAENLLGKNVE